MKKKIIFTLLVLFVAVSSLSCASAFWFFGGGSDVTVNEINFHIPDGFEEIENEHELNDQYEKVAYSNDKDEELDIEVIDNYKGFSSVRDVDWGVNSAVMREKSISGKDGMVSYKYIPSIWYGYIENGKLVMIVCPNVFDDGTAYYEFLEDVIK